MTLRSFATPIILVLGVAAGCAKSTRLPVRPLPSDSVSIMTYNVDFSDARDRKHYERSRSRKSISCSCKRLIGPGKTRYSRT